jgi:ATP-dependent helicase/nuclease subunit B
VDGVPSVASRWLLRLKALLNGLDIADALAAKDPWLAWARNRDSIPVRRTIMVPEPRPPLELRPRRMSLSDVETWIANPYAIYAKHVLGLEALPVLGVRPGPSEKGQILHEALSRFAKAHPGTLPNDVAAAVLALAVDVASELGAEPRVRAFWLPRFKRFAEWFAEKEPGLRDKTTKLMTEVEGAGVIEAPGGPFSLRGRADRIDITREGIIITDYKTGSPPSDAAVNSGLAPQLPLEAAMAAAGSFTGLPASTVAGLRYIRASGGEPPGDIHDVKLKDTDPAKLGTEVWQKLIALIVQFDDAKTPYRALRRRRFKYDYDDFAGLARVGEWSVDEDGGEGAA